MMTYPWRTIESLSVSFGIILIILLTVGGNLVVLFAFFNDPHLLTPSNNFLLSMAIADLLVGLICMPFYSYAQVKNYWPFGKLFCKIWITIDDVVTMASVLSIVAITIERYWSINHSVHYRRHTTKARIRIFSILIWLIPCLNFAPGIWFLKSSEDNNQLLDKNYYNRTLENKFECIGAYHSHTIYLIIAQINFFAWPLVVIIVLNALIVVNLYKRSHRFPVFASFRVIPNKQQQQKNTLYRQKINEEQQQQQHAQQISTDIQTITVVNEANCCLLNKTDVKYENINNNYDHSENHEQSDRKDIIEIRIEDDIDNIHTNPIPSISESESRQQPTNIYTRFKHVFLTSTTQLEPLHTERSSSKSTQTLRVPSMKKKPKHNPIIVWHDNSVLASLVDTPLSTNPGTGEQRTVRRLRRDKRAATSLFTLVFVFMIFLLPYVVVVVVGRIFSFEILTDTNSQVYSAAFWLLWLNSTVNPILYPFIQPRFREAYRKLFIRFTRRRRRLVSLIVDMQRTK